MISICQRLLNTSDVSRALLKSSFNSHNNPVADSPLYRQGLRLGEKVTRLDGERQWRDSNPHLRADKGLGGGRPVCAHVGLWLKSWGQVRPPKKQTNSLEIPGRRGLSGVQCSLGFDHWDLGMGAQKEGNPFSTQFTGKGVHWSRLLSPSLSDSAMPTVLIPSALPPGGPWALRPDCSFSSLREQCPERKPRFLTACLFAKVTPLGQQRAFLSSCLIKVVASTSGNHPVNLLALWINNTAGAEDRMASRSRALGSSLSPCQVSPAWVEGGPALSSQSTGHFWENASFPQLEIIDTKVLGKSKGSLSTPEIFYLYDWAVWCIWVLIKFVLHSGD